MLIVRSFFRLRLCPHLEHGTLGERPNSAGSMIASAVVPIRCAMENVGKIPKKLNKRLCNHRGNFDHDTTVFLCRFLPNILLPTPSRSVDSAIPV